MTATSISLLNSNKESHSRRLDKAQEFLFQEYLKPALVTHQLLLERFQNITAINDPLADPVKRDGSTPKVDYLYYL